MSQISFALITFVHTVAALALPVATSAADPVMVYTYTPKFDGPPRHIEANPNTTGGTSPAENIVRNYDNFNQPTSLVFAYRTGSREIADDLQLAQWGPGVVADVGWTVFNASSTNTLASVRATIRFYDADRQFLFADSGVFTPNLAPGRGARYITTGGAYVPAAISTSRNMFMSIQFSESVGVAIDDLGTRYGGPIGVGDSSRFIYDFTNNQQIDLGDTPQANLGFFLYSVPAPGATTFVALALTPLARRRR
ncbi:MAG: hypothetical protein SFZ23_13185 [Planctomycetota bacterium]|nr:hypothetical protein [Planctomycetota bacterium]